MSSDKGPVTILGRFEKINLILPPLFILSSLVCLALGYKLEPRLSIALSFIGQYLLFDWTHVLLTFFFLASFPEAKALIKSSWKSERLWFALGIGFALYVAVIYLILKLFVIGAIVTFLLYVIPNFLLFRHATKQTFGMSMLYNAGAGEENSLSLEQKERFYFKVLVGVVVVNEFSSKIPLFSALSPWVRLAPVLIAAYLVFNVCVKLQGKIWLNKKIYLSRIFLYPLSLVSPIAAVGYPSLHGFEYMLLLANMTKRSRLQRKKIVLCALPLVAYLVSIPLIIYQDREFIPRQIERYVSGDSHIIAIAFLTFFTTASFVHYYLDSILFKMRHPIIRQNMSQLVLPEESSASSGKNPLHEQST